MSWLKSFVSELESDLPMIVTPLKLGLARLEKSKSPNGFIIGVAFLKKLAT